MSVISNLLSTIFPTKSEYRALMVGLDAAGRTTLLYHWALGEIVTTIPTIGFNVETVRYKNMSLTAWDVGGCDKIRPLWRHYFVNTQIVMFVVDSNDVVRMDEVEWSLGLLLREEELKDAIFCVIAAKQDLPNAKRVPEIVQTLKLQQHLKNHVWICLPCSSLTGDGCYEILDWISRTLVERKERNLKNPPPVVEKKEKKEEKEESILEKWLKVEDEPDDEFLKKFTNYELEVWDHRTHLRIAWLYLTRDGRREGMKKIFEGIKNFIANSTRTQRSRGTTFHETLTYFWVHMVHYAIEATKNPLNNFKGFLVLNPQLSDGGLFLEYYKKETMMNNPEARTQVVLPDKKPLPSIISDLSQKKDKKIEAIEEAMSQTKIQTDEDFLEDFISRKLNRWGHECFLRVIYVNLKQKGRKKGVDDIFSQMESFMKDGFHFTLTYFWIQMVELANKKFESKNFEEFFKQASSLLEENLVYTYYSKEKIFSKEAEKSMVLPDKKQIPSVV